jgi:molybdopterin molybdotransferase
LIFYHDREPQTEAMVAQSVTEAPYFIDIESAVAIATKTLLSVGVEDVPLDEAHGRILADDLCSKVDDPPFDNSAMDGFAFIHEDSLQPPNTLKIVQTIQAGERETTQPLKRGQASRIMTGGPIPPGADSILPIERCEMDEAGAEVTLAEQGRPHFIRKQGENLKRGEVTLEKGTTLTPANIGLCATMGWPTVPVFKRAKVAILSTGDELKLPGEPLEAHEIYESNSFGLAGLVEWMGHEAVRYPSVNDSMDALRSSLTTAAKECDLILTSGGVSMGEWDYVRKIMEEEGDVHFWRVKIRPGSPPLFGTWNSTPIFGLPGNPASSHVVFRILVAPYLRASVYGGGPKEHHIMVELGEDIKGDANCLALRRISIDTSGDHPIAYSTGHQGSGNLSGVARADGLTLLSPGQPSNKGDRCRAMFL